MKDIDLLLEKYWEAETSLEEEATLRRYFSSHKVADQHKPYQGLFAYQTILASQKSVRAMPQLADQSPASTGGRVVKMQPLRWLVNAAAIALVVLAFVWMMRPADTTPQPQLAEVIRLDEHSEQDQALEATKEALAFLSTKLDTKARAIRGHVKHTEKADIFR